VWVEVGSNPGHFLLQDLIWAAVSAEIDDFFQVGLAQHFRLRKHQLVNGVLGDVGPVDEMVDHVLIYPEWEDLGNSLDLLNVIVRNPMRAQNVSQMTLVEEFEFVPGSFSDVGVQWSWH
jgi:hypothetical protein